MLKRMVALTALMVSSIVFAQDREYVVMVYGGAGVMAGLEEDPVKLAQYYAALDSVLMIGDKVPSAEGEGPKTVMAVVNYFEGNPSLNAEIGATCTVKGTFELDASIMGGKDLSVGAVVGSKHVKYPINTACAIRAKSPYIILSGAGAEKFVKEQGLEMVEDDAYFATPETTEWIEKLKQKSKKNSTVGRVVPNRRRNLAAGTSTGGMFKKRWERIGNPFVIGTGAYVSNNSCAVSCTGHGEYFIHHVVTFDVRARYRYLKESVEKTADYIIHTELSANAGNDSLITADKLGNITIPYNNGGMFHGFLYKEKGSPETKKGCDIGKKIVVVGEK